MSGVVSICVFPKCGVHVKANRGGRFFKRADGSEFGACFKHAPVVAVGRVAAVEVGSFALGQLEKKYPTLVAAVQTVADHYARFHQEDVPASETEPEIIDAEFVEVK